MTKNDKLRFEVGAGFNKLSQTSLDELEEMYDSFLDEMEKEYGYSGDSPYYDATNEYLHELRARFNDDEEFIQAVANHSDYSTFGWALSKLIDKDIYNYARQYFFDIMSSDDCYAEDEINEYLNYKTLPR